MFLDFDFASVGAITDVTYRFVGADGAFIGAAQTDAVNMGSVAGWYGVEVTPPSGAVAVYWACSDATLYGRENIDHRLTMEALSVPTAAAIADAVLDEDVSTGTPGDTTLRGIFCEATAETPVIAPSPPSDSSLCTVFVYTETLTNLKRAGIKLAVTLVTHPAKSERVLEVEAAEMTTDSDGFAYMTLQRTDTMTPAGSVYRVNCPELGFNNLEFELEAETFDLASLIV